MWVIVGDVGSILLILMFDLILGKAKYNPKGLDYQYPIMSKHPS